MIQDLNLETMDALCGPLSLLLVRGAVGLYDWENEPLIESELTYFHYNSSPNAEFILSSMNKKPLLGIC